MSGYFVAPIVEGHGEVQAVPILLRRVFADLRTGLTLQVNPALRIKSANFLADGEYFSKYLELAARKAKPHVRGSVLILLDCEDSCPAETGPELLKRATALRADIPTTVALAYREYETWFLAAARSLRGSGGLPPDLAPPEAPESIRDAKGWLAARMPAGYNEPNHQPAFTERFSMDEAATIASFARLRRKLRELFSA